MDNYKRISTLSAVVPAAASVAISKCLTDTLSAHLSGYPLLLAANICAYAVCYHVSAAILTHLLVSVSAVRRLLLGRQYVEGTWVLRAFRGASTEQITILRYEPAEGGLRWSGTSYKQDGSLKGGVAASVFFIDWPRMRHTYEAHRTEGAVLAQGGYGERMFIERHGPSVQFTGFFVDFRTGVRHDTEARKIEDNATLKALDDPDELRRFLTAEFSKLPPPKAE